MNIAIVNRDSGRTTMYTSADLRLDARHAVKGKGKLVAYWVQVTEGASCVLVAQYQQHDGRSASVNVAI